MHQAPLATQGQLRAIISPITKPSWQISSAMTHDIKVPTDYQWSAVGRKLDFMSTNWWFRSIQQWWRRQRNSSWMEEFVCRYHVFHSGLRRDIWILRRCSWLVPVLGRSRRGSLQLGVSLACGRLNRRRRYEQRCHFHGSCNDSWQGVHGRLEYAPVQNAYGTNLVRWGELNLLKRIEGILSMKPAPDFVQIMT